VAEVQEGEGLIKLLMVRQLLEMLCFAVNLADMSTNKIAAKVNLKYIILFA